MVAAAVAIGAVTAASQGLQHPERSEASTLLALGSDTTASAGLGGGNPPSIAELPRPEVLPVALDTHAPDVTSLAKGQRIADEHAAEVATATRQAAASAAQKAAEVTAAAKATADRATDNVLPLGLGLGKVVLPAHGQFTSGFGGRWGAQHYGIDIANSIGTPIYATADGVVIESGPASGFGMWVRLRHGDGTISVYGHINTSLVSEGQRVSAGEQIATIGNRGQSTGPHLHFEIWLGGVQKINPLTWLHAHGIDL
ncbi:MAG TPA: M23 family metallopeptidase [Pseudonocardiaceae bacterium]|jgi:murein DD-endopeptidase MepM/ murein hydrolase activator NlpD